MYDSNFFFGELFGIFESYKLFIVGVLLKKKSKKNLFRNWYEIFFKEVEENDVI